MKHKNLYILVLLLVGIWTLGFAQSANLPGPPASGNQDCINVLTPSGTIGTSYTVEAWIYPTYTTTTVNDIPTFGFTILASSNTMDTYPLWITHYNGELRLWTWEVSAPVNVARTTSGAGIVANHWYHIAVTSTKGGNTSVYIDGESVLSFTNDADNNWSTQLTIGALRPTRNLSNLPFFGLIDEVRIWDDIRTLTEITDNMNNEINLTDPTATQGLVGYWNFNTTEDDLSSNNLTTTLQNGAQINGIQNPNVGPPITLPVELSSFTAIPTADYFVRLNWVTQSETGVSGFKIFRGRSNDLSEATDMNVFIEANNTATTQVYSYVDTELDGDGTYYYWLQNIDLDGSNRYYGPVTATVNQTGGGSTPPVIELQAGIEKIYPNPFNPQTNIRLRVLEDAPVEVVIYNLRGQKVRDLFSAQKTAGFHNLQWNGLDNSGMPCSSGVYTVRVKIGTEVYAKQMVMSK